eukprot:4713568-Ditylum_brightwellii.AAC.1
MQKNDIKDLEGETPAPSTCGENSFKQLTNFLEGGLNEGDYTCQGGPVVKLVQSLFNKLYVWHG